MGQTLFLIVMLVAFTGLLGACTESTPSSNPSTPTSPSTLSSINNTTLPDQTLTIPVTTQPLSSASISSATTPPTTSFTIASTGRTASVTANIATATVQVQPSASHVTGSGTIRGCEPAISPPLNPNSGIGDLFYPTLGNPGYYVQHYNIDLISNFPAKSISATVTLQVKAEQSLNSLNLDFQGFSIQEIKVSSTVVSDYTRNASKLLIKLPQTMQPDQIFPVTISYSGEPQSLKSTAIPIPVGWLQYNGGTFVLSEPSGAEGWFPVNDHPCDKAIYTMRITAPKPYSVAANGELKDTFDNGSTRTFHWETRDPLAPYLVTMAVGNFVEQTQSGPANLPIRNFFPTNLAAQASNVFSPTAAIIEFYSSRFGPYPFETYGALVVDTTLAASLETQTLSLFGRNIVLNNQSAEIAVPHELAHQWFGDSVSLKSWKDIWLNEGFATYAESMWYEHVHGKQALDNLMRELYQEQRQKPDPPPGNPPPDNLFNKGVYNRGALTLHALRLKLGDDTFFNILRTYAGRYRNGNASTPDFVAVANEVSGQNLQDFFNGWLYNPAIPPIPEMNLGGNGGNNSSSVATPKK